MGYVITGFICFIVGLGFGMLVMALASVDRGDRDR